jgi:hypothetical protein
MTTDSKNEADKLTTNESSREITADELNQGMGGMVLLHPKTTTYNGRAKNMIPSIGR